MGVIFYSIALLGINGIACVSSSLFYISNMCLLFLFPDTASGARLVEGTTQTVFRKLNYCIQTR